MSEYMNSWFSKGAKLYYFYIKTLLINPIPDLDISTNFLYLREDDFDKNVENGDRAVVSVCP